MKHHSVLRLLAASSTLLLSGISCAHAETYSSFNVANIFGVGLTEVSAAPNFNYSVSLHQGDYFTLGNAPTKYYINQIFGVYQLFNTPISTKTNVSGPLGWSNVDDYKNNTHTGQMFGFKHPSNSGSGRIDIGESLSGFVFASNTPSDFGFHFSYSTDSTFTTGVTTAYFKDSPGDEGFPPQSIPEPDFYQMSALFILGGVSILRRRKKFAEV